MNTNPDKARIRLERALTQLGKYFAGAPLISDLAIITDKTTGDATKAEIEDLKKIQLEYKKYVTNRNEFEKAIDEFFGSSQRFPSVAALCHLYDVTIKSAEMVTKATGGGSTDEVTGAFFSDLSLATYAGLSQVTGVSVLPHDHKRKIFSGTQVSELPATKRHQGVGALPETELTMDFLNTLLLRPTLDISLFTEKKECPIQVIQCTNPRFDVSSKDADLVSMFMNGIPGSEMSQAVPYLQVEFLTVENTKKSSTTLPITTSRYLLGIDKGNNLGNKNFIEAEFMSKSVSENDKKLETVAGMDIFTSPQTMISNREGVDKFRPLMSILDFSLDQQAPSLGGDPASAKRQGTLNLLLHDRKRLKDVSDLVRPEGLSTGKVIRINWGWSHGGNSSSNPSSSSTDQNRQIFPDIIDNFKVSEVFTVHNTEFSFADSGEVKIVLTMTSLGLEQDLSSISLTDAWAEAFSEESLLKDIDSLKTYLSNNSKKKQSRMIAAMSRHSVLSKDGKIRKLKYDSNMIEAFLGVKEKMMTPGQPLNATELAKAVTDVLNSEKDEAAGKVQFVSKKGMLEKILKSYETGVDTFASLRPVGLPSIGSHGVPGWPDGTVGFTGDPNNAIKSAKWITLGKLVSSIIGSALTKKFAGILEEVQIVWYGFNESAGGCNDMCLSAMPLLLSDVKKVLKEEFESNGGDLSLQQFVNILDENFVNKQSSHAYGIEGARKYYYNKKRKKRSSKKMSAEECLHKIYGTEEGEPVVFKPAKLVMTTELRPGTNNLGVVVNGGHTAKPILRICFSDSNAGIAGTLERILESNISKGLFFPLKRLSRSNDASQIQIGNRHNTFHEHWAGGIEKIFLKSSKAIEQSVIDQVKNNIKASKSKDKNKKMEKILTGLQKGRLFNMTPVALKTALTTLFPTIIYGGTNTAITNASVASMKSGDMVTLALERRNTAKKATSKESNEAPTEGITMVYPVKISIDSLGCPYLNFNQKFFLDFGADGTDIDNVYNVTNIKHTISPGEFKTSFELINAGGLGTYASAEQSVTELVAMIVTMLEQEVS